MDVFIPQNFSIISGPQNNFSPIISFAFFTLVVFTVPVSSLETFLWLLHWISCIGRSQVLPLTLESKDDSILPLGGRERREFIL